MHKQIDTDADLDALCEFLGDGACSKALAQSGSAQQHIFHLMHKQSQSMLGGQCKGRLSRVLEACSTCCTPADGPALHHTLCIAALQDGRMEEALQAVVTLQEETRDSSMHAMDEAGEQDEVQRKSQHLSACLLRLKIETMVSLLPNSPALLASIP